MPNGWYGIDFLSKPRVQEQDRRKFNIFLSVVVCLSVVSTSAVLISLRLDETISESSIVTYDMIEPVNISVQLRTITEYHKLNYTNYTVSLHLNETQNLTMFNSDDKRPPLIKIFDEKWINLDEQMMLALRVRVIIGITIIDNQLNNTKLYFYSIRTVGTQTITCPYDPFECTIYSLEPELTVIIITKRYTYTVFGMISNVGGLVSIILTIGSILSRCISICSRRHQVGDSYQESFW